MVIHPAKGTKPQAPKTKKEIQELRSIVDKLPLVKTRKTLLKPKQPLDAKGSEKLGMFIEEQNYLEELESKDERYVRRWEDHRNREWEEVYFREED